MSNTRLSSTLSANPRKVSDMSKTGKQARQVGLSDATIIATKIASTLITGKRVVGNLVTDDVGLAIQEDIKGDRVGIMHHEWSGIRHYEAFWHEVTNLTVRGNEFHTETKQYKTRAAFEPVALGHTKTTETTNAKTIISYNWNGKTVTWTLDGISPNKVRDILRFQLARCQHGFPAAQPTQRSKTLAESLKILMKQFADGKITQDEYERHYRNAVEQGSDDPRPTSSGQGASDTPHRTGPQDVLGTDGHSGAPTAEAPVRLPDIPLNTTHVQAQSVCTKCGNPIVSPTAKCLSCSSVEQAKSQVIVYGYSQRYAVNPDVEIFWDGKPLGRVKRGGRVAITIPTDGELSFKASLRKASIHVSAGRTTHVRLRWGATGKLIASASDSASVGNQVG